eukprot:4097004-Pleurochrysis_carterae.AAC.1
MLQGRARVEVMALEQGQHAASERAGVGDYVASDACVQGGRAKHRRRSGDAVEGEGSRQKEDAEGTRISRQCAGISESENGVQADGGTLA